MKNRHTAKLASFVILQRGNEILLARRYNTGYSDGLYQMPSGHVERDEYPIEAAKREVEEEVGISVNIEDLEQVHTSFRINRNDEAGDYVDFFFRATKWEGEPKNMEPDKCDEVRWVPIDDLPENTVPVIKHVIGCIREGIPFSEIGRP